jgi:hypothetical protein
VFGSSKRAHGTHKQRSVGEMLFEMLDFDQSGEREEGTQVHWGGQAGT